MVKFQISPQAQMIVGGAVAVLTLAAHGTLALPVGIPPEADTIITSWANFVLQIYAVVSPIMVAYSNSDPGPLAPADPPAVKTLQLQAQKADLDTQIAAVTQEKKP
jgi:hypothetical protein